MKRGDDLEDDFILDDIVALSEDEDESSEGHDPMSTQSEERDEPESSATQDTSEKNDKKRKRREKEREKFKEKKRKLAANETSFERSVGEQSPNDLAEYLFAMHARTLDNLVDFIVKVLPNLRLRLSQRSKASGAPTLLFVAGAALRVVDVTRVLKDTKLRGEKGGEVAKLFAKHFKLAEHVTYLKRTKVGSAVGTPGRIGKLLCETDALTVSALSHIILDVSFRDTKKRNMLEIPETRDEVFKTVLGAPKVLQAIKEGKIQVVLF
ncbi:U3-containing 90S pre-ribosomal complex subunit-domain containing protein [Mycena vulgaris]|nr:U3-containing 90S pre-ribosomal complex subunit-domain containing protein [Mycena vulgaris]